MRQRGGGREGGERALGGLQRDHHHQGGGPGGIRQVPAVGHQGDILRTSAWCGFVCVRVCVCVCVCARVFGASRRRVLAESLLGFPRRGPPSPPASGPPRRDAPAGNNLPKRAIPQLLEFRIFHHARGPPLAPRLGSPAQIPRAASEPPHGPLIPRPPPPTPPPPGAPLLLRVGRPPGEEGGGRGGLRMIHECTSCTRTQARALPTHARTRASACARTHVRARARSARTRTHTNTRAHTRARAHTHTHTHTHTQSMYGDQRRLTMRFYLADDTMVCVCVCE